MNPELVKITNRIIEKSYIKRQQYLSDMAYAENQHKRKSTMGCTNMAHACAALPNDDKQKYIDNAYNIGIITAYNDMLSAHQPFEKFPDIIRSQASLLGMTAQVAGGVPAMCDGITQGYEGMELSLFSRDIIAQATAVGLSHACFDGVVYLGVCDKIIPALLIASMRFGHLPSVFCPAGPMASGLSNSDKAKTRADYASGKVDKDTLLQSELKSYHGAGTCTFYGTANSNQLLMEIAGLHLPHTTFIPPNTFAREKATRQSVTALKAMIENTIPLYKLIDERTIVNMIVALNATGGSTNLTIHLITIAKAAGIAIDWHDMNDISKITPLLTNLYPNGSADVNEFHHAGGIGYVINQLFKAGLLHDTPTINGTFLSSYQTVDNHNHDIIRPIDNPFSPTGGLITVTGNIGIGIVKISAISSDKYVITAPAKVFYTQEDFKTAFEKKLLNMDCVVVLPFQGAGANGMPELHKLIPALTVLQNRGFKVALITDGRMSGASGKVPAAIHISPEASKGGVIGKISDGDMVTLDCNNGTIIAQSSFNNNTIPTKNHQGFGREMFDIYRQTVSSANLGASIFNF